MKGKKIAIIFIMLLAMSIALSAVMVSAQLVKEPAINVSILNQDPDPASPGTYVDLRFRVFNDAPGTTAQNVELKILPAFPFSLDPGITDTISAGDLAGEGSSRNSFVTKFRMRVADNAVTGTNPIKISYRIDGGEWFTQEFNINVQVLDANIAIESVDSTPQSINPGEQAVLKIKVKNMAQSPLKDITMKLDLTFSNLLGQKATLTAADTIAAYNAIPLAPLGSSTEQKIYSLDPGEETTFTYNLIAFPNAVSQVYKVPIELNYYDQLNNQYSKDDLIGVVIGSKPDLSVLVDSTTIIAGKKAGTVTVKFVNKGVTGVKFLDVKLAPTKDFDVTSAQEVYVGSVDSDDYQTADYSLYLNTAGSKVVLPIVAEYRDANNNLYNETYNLELDVLNQAEKGQQAGSPVGLIIIVLIVIGVIYFFIRRRRKSK